MKMKKPIVVERFADNGEHSHWELIEPDDCAILWSGHEECSSNKSIEDKIIEAYPDTNITVYNGSYSSLCTSDLSRTAAKFGYSLAKKEAVDRDRMREESYHEPIMTLEDAAKKYSNMHKDVTTVLGKHLIKGVFIDAVHWHSKQIPGATKVPVVGYSLQDMFQSWQEGAKYSDDNPNMRENFSKWLSKYTLAAPEIESATKRTVKK